MFHQPYLCARTQILSSSALVLAKLAFLASMAQFIQHLGTVHGLIDFFWNNHGEIQIP